MSRFDGLFFPSALMLALIFPEMIEDPMFKWPIFVGCALMLLVNILRWRREARTSA